MTAAWTSATTAASPGITTTIWPSASSTRCRPTCAVPITSAADCRTTTHGADPARCAPKPAAVNTDWFTVAGGDGFYTRQDPTDWAIVYGESQDGNMTPPRSAHRHPEEHPAHRRPRHAADADRATNPTGPTEGPSSATSRRRHHSRDARSGGSRRRTRRRWRRTRRRAQRRQAPPKVEAFRFYWNAPIEISPHNPAVIYMAAQYFFKSNNRGDTWWMNHKDLSKNIDRWSPEMAIMSVAGDKPMAEKHDGYAASSLATQVRESPSRPGIIWIGTEDGNLQVSMDGGETFTNVYGNITGAPKGYMQISRIEPSHFDPGTAYVAMDHHRYDDSSPTCSRPPTSARPGPAWPRPARQGQINALREDYDNPEPALGRHRIRSLRDPRWRQGMEEVHDRTCPPCAWTIFSFIRATAI